MAWLFIRRISLIARSVDWSEPAAAVMSWLRRCVTAMVGAMITFLAMTSKMAGEPARMLLTIGALGASLTLYAPVRRAMQKPRALSELFMNWSTRRRTCLFDSLPESISL